MLAMSLTVVGALLLQQPVFVLPAEVHPVVTSPCTSVDDGLTKPVAEKRPDTPARLRKQVPVRSPSAFIDAKIAEGSAFVSAVIDTDGKTCDVHVVRVSHEGFGLEEASLEAVKQWEFFPAKRGGAPVRTTTIIRLAFGKGAREP